MWVVVGLVVALLVGCTEEPEPVCLFDCGQWPECPAGSAVPLASEHQMVVSFLGIGAADEGFDLDGDGRPDNQFHALRDVARPALDEAFRDFRLIVPMELLGYDGDLASPDDECVQVALYRGHYSLDRDGDGYVTARGRWSRGDCNDHDETIHPAATEIVGNAKDDDCDGLADEMELDDGDGTITVQSNDVFDRDGDGVTIAAGDCDDTEPQVQGSSMTEICGDGLDNDCDGIADFDPACTPYDATADVLYIDEASLDRGVPTNYVRSGAVVVNDGTPHLVAGPSELTVAIRFADIGLSLHIFGAFLEADLVPYADGWGLTNGRIGGVLHPAGLTATMGETTNICLYDCTDTLMDAIFANLLGRLLGLPTNESGCHMMDIDVDGDGLEAFCDSNPLDEVNHADMCIDGDGSVHLDEEGDDPRYPIRRCTEFRDGAGALRFMDGISIQLEFEAVPAVLVSQIE